MPFIYNSQSKVANWFADSNSPVDVTLGSSLLGLNMNTEEFLI